MTKVAIGQIKQFLVLPQCFQLFSLLNSNIIEGDFPCFCLDVFKVICCRFIVYGKGLTLYVKNLAIFPFATMFSTVFNNYSFTYRFFQFCLLHVFSSTGQRPEGLMSWRFVRRACVRACVRPSVNNFLLTRYSLHF